MSNRIQSLQCLAFIAALAAMGVTSPVSAQGRGRAPAAQAQAPASDGVVNIQTASADQLALLPGIGPSKAAAIVAYREQHAFHHVEEIMRVRGIGRATFRRLRSMLTVQGATTLSERPNAPRAQRQSNEESEE